jgi:hypothetical protein
MMWADKDISGSEQAEQAASLAYLESRVREEADAAARAASVEATLAHVVLATAYAKRLNECSNGRLALPADSWAQEHRLW